VSEVVVERPIQLGDFLGCAPSGTSRPAKRQALPALLGREGAPSATGRTSGHDSTAAPFDSDAGQDPHGGRRSAGRRPAPRLLDSSTCPASA
jgi:hypothetical protein